MFICSSCLLIICYRPLLNRNGRLIKFIIMVDEVECFAPTLLIINFIVDPFRCGGSCIQASVNEMDRPLNFIVSCLLLAGPVRVQISVKSKWRSTKFNDAAIWFARPAYTDQCQVEMMMLLKFTGVALCLRDVYRSVSSQNDAFNKN